MGMGNFRFHSAAIGFPKGAPPLLVQGYSCSADDEIAPVDLAAVDHTNSDAIGDERPEFLHQVERQCRPAIAWLMHNAEEWIETHRMADPSDLLAEDAVSHR